MSMRCPGGCIRSFPRFWRSRAAVARFEPDDWKARTRFGALMERIVARKVNGLRAELGVRPFSTIDASYLAADVVIAYTAEPFEYPRSDWAPNVRLVGPGLWEPPADVPAWLGDLSRPLVLVTCSTLVQNDRRLAEVACRAFAGEPLDVVVTTGDIDPATLASPANVRVERFVPHSPVLARAACVVCHAGMGITQKALAHGVPSSPSPSAVTSPRSPRPAYVCPPVG